MFGIIYYIILYIIYYTKLQFGIIYCMIISLFLKLKWAFKHLEILLKLRTLAPLLRISGQ